MLPSSFRTPLLSILVFFAAFNALGQTFKTQSPASVGLQESFRVQYVLSTDEATGFHCPASPDFEILGGPSTSTFSSHQWVNGKSSSSSSITYTYILQPRRTGRLSLPRPTVKANGKVITATAATINVTAGGSSSSASSSSSAAASSRNARSSSPRSLSKNDIFVRCIPSKTDIYEQEPVSVSYKVYARSGVILSNVQPNSKPEMKGFWTQEVNLPSNLQATHETINGIPYSVYTMLQYVAFPQKSGALTIAPLTTECSILQNDPNIDPLDAFFNGGGTLSANVTRGTDIVKFNVRPLPTPRPAGFSGAVGTLSVEGKLLTPSPATNDIATYRITVSGQGNMKLIQAPAVSFPPSFDKFDPTIKDETKLRNGTIAGTITFDYTFVPRQEGDFQIPATSFIYFDLSTGSYRTVTLPVTSLHVKKGQRSREDVEREIALRQSTIRPDHKASASHASLNFVLYGVLLVLLALIAWLVSHLLGMPLATKLRTKWQHSGHQRNKHLAAAEKAMQQQNPQAFYAALEQAFHAAATPREDAEGILSRRFAPDAASPDNLKQAMNDARRILLTLLLVLLPAIGISANTSTLSPADSCYNAGNRAYQIKEHAKAVLCYSRALWLDPGNEDARFNLSLVQTHLEDRFSTPQKMFFTTWIGNLCTSRTKSSWLAIALIFFTALLVCIVAFRHSANKYVRHVTFYLGIPLLILFITTNVFAICQHYNRHHNTQAVIMADEALCYDSPVADGKPSATLHAGTLVNIASTYGNGKVEITLPDGRQVWIAENSIEQVAR